LVKVTSLIAKEDSKSDGLTDKDMEEIYSAIQGDKDDK